MKNQLVVNFGALSVGNHDFSFELSKEHWLERPSGRVKNGSIDVLLKVEKSERHMLFSYLVKGDVTVSCDNCLNELKYPINKDVSLHVKLTDEEIVDEVDLIHLPTNTTHLNLTDHFMDSVELSLPMRTLCQDSLNRQKCDDDYLKRLNSNETVKHDVHPEMEKLKDLFKQN